MKLFNTLTRKLEKFRPAGEVVKIYTCGPTVYNDAHIGNLTAYIYWDLLVRALKAEGHAVRRVLNLTDVGHLVSDGDEGEDKLEKGAAREGKSVYEVAEQYIERFMGDYAALELTPPEVLARATSYIEADMQAVDLMRAHGYTYETQDGVYFDTAKFAGYTELARLDLAGLKAGARVEFSSEKRGAADFAVWKFIQPGEKHAMRWDYLGRPGYPGWHLECATIIHEELGEPIDIHTGGVDHIPVHHTNEIAETYAAYGAPLARVWLHCNFITIDGEKISKSLGNVWLLSDLAARGFSPMDYKMWVLSGHYQGTRNFTWEGLEAAQARRRKWRNRIARCYQGVGDFDGAGNLGGAGGAENFGGVGGTGNLDGAGAWERILAAVGNNLNSAEAFKVIDGAELSLEDWRRVDELFGLRLMVDSPLLVEETQALFAARAEARAAKDYAKSDELRAELAAKGIKVLDTAEGQVWEYA